MGNDREKIKIRFAIETDARDVFNWRNDPVTRQNSFSSDEISWEQHINWFTKALQNKNRLLLIGEYNDKKLGVIRFDIEHDFAEININVNPAMRGKGYGSKLIVNSVNYYYKKANLPEKIIAKIKKENVPSQKIFQKAEFILVDDGDIITMEYKK